MELEVIVKGCDSNSENETTTLH